MPVSELLDLLQCVEDENTNDTWLNTMCRRIKVKVMGKKDPNLLHVIFKKFDIKNSGVLATPDFKSCFL
jgi:hypothetical protein